MESQNEPKSGGQTLGYVLPLFASRITSVYPAVVLLIKQTRLGWMGQNFVRALAKIGKPVGQKVGPHTLIQGFPRLPGVGGAEYSNR